MHDYYALWWRSCGQTCRRGSAPPKLPKTSCALLRHTGNVFIFHQLLLVSCCNSTKQLGPCNVCLCIFMFVCLGFRVCVCLFVCFLVCINFFFSSAAACLLLQQHETVGPLQWRLLPLAHWRLPLPCRRVHQVGITFYYRQKT